MSLLTAVEAIGRLLSSYPTVNHVYAFAYCATNATQYYAHYYHKRYSNYDQPARYQTLFLYENADTRFSLPNQNSHYANHLYYFETIAEYNNFCDQWNL